MGLKLLHAGHSHTGGLGLSLHQSRQVVGQESQLQQLRRGGTVLSIIVRLKLEQRLGEAAEFRHVRHKLEPHKFHPDVRPAQIKLHRYQLSLGRAQGPGRRIIFLVHIVVLAENKKSEL